MGGEDVPSLVRSCVTRGSYICRLTLQVTQPPTAWTSKGPISDSMPQMRVPPDFGGLGAVCAFAWRAARPAASAYRPAPPAMPACRKSLRDIDLAHGSL